MVRFARIARLLMLLGMVTLLMPLAALRGAAAQDEPTTVTFWTTFSDVSLESLERIVEEFNAQSEDVEVVLEQIPPTEVTDVAKLMTAVRGGTGPDVYLLDRFIVAQRAAEGLLTDLGQYLDTEALADQHLPFAWDEATFEGVAYAVPFDTDARALYYNKALLEEAGIDPAELDPANGPITFDRLAEIAAALNVTDEAGNYVQMGFVPWFDQGWHYSYGFAFGGDFFDEEACVVTPTDPEIVEAFEWVQDFSEQMGPQQTQAFIQEAMQPGFPIAQSPFVRGQLGLEVGIDSLMAALERYAPDLDYGITYLPVPEEGAEPATWAGGWSLVIPQGADNPEAAAEFIEFAAGEPGQRIFVEDTQHLPTLTALLEDETLFDERHQFFTDELLPITKSRPALPVGALYWDELTDAWQATYLVQEEAADALATAQERVQPQLEQFCPIVADVEAEEADVAEDADAEAAEA